MKTIEYFYRTKQLKDPGARYAAGHFITAKQMKNRNLKRKRGEE